MTTKTTATPAEDAPSEPTASPEAGLEEAAPEKPETEDEEVSAEAAEDAADEEPSDTKVRDEKTSDEQAARKRASPQKATGGKGSRRPSVRVSRRLVAAALALVFLTAVATAGLQWREADRLGGQDRTEQLVRTRSAEFARALLAYRHSELDTAQARIRELSSADFNRTYETAFGGLAEVISKYQADATATVRDTYLNGFDGERAKSIVVLDSEVRSTLGVRRVLGTKLMLELVLEKGAWRVDSMVTLPADDETLTKPDGTVEGAEKDDADTKPDAQTP